MYDRIIRIGFWTSNRVVGLHNDSHRLFYMLLVCRSDDFGCQAGDFEELLREICHVTQIRTTEAIGAAVQAMADRDLVRVYEVGLSTTGQTYEVPAKWQHQTGKIGLYLPRFLSTRTYSRRLFAPSPWCQPERERYGAVRQSTIISPRLRAQDKPSTNANPVQALSPIEHKPAQDLSQQPPSNVAPAQQVPQVPDSLELTSEPVPDQRQISADLTRGWGGEERGSKESSSKQRSHTTNRGTRIPQAWTIPDEWIHWAIGNALDQGHHVTMPTVHRVAQHFHNHYLAKTGVDATSVNWLARWRSWWAREDLAKLATQRPEPPADAISRAR